MKKDFRKYILNKTFLHIEDSMKKEFLKYTFLPILPSKKECLILYLVKISKIKKNNKILNYQQ